MMHVEQQALHEAREQQRRDHPERDPDERNQRRLATDQPGDAFGVAPSARRMPSSRVP